MEATLDPSRTYGWLSTPAAEMTLWSRDVEAALQLIRTELRALSDHEVPVLDAAAQAWQQLEDLIDEPRVPGDAGRTVWGRLGLDPGSPLRIVLADVEGTQAGRALTRVLAAFDAGQRGSTNAQLLLDEALTSTPVAQLHLRALARVESSARLAEAVRFHAEQRGWAVFEPGEAPPDFVRGAVFPPDTIVVAQSRTQGHLLVLRGQDAARSLDLVLAVSSRVPLASLLRTALIVGSVPALAPAESHLRLTPAGLAKAELSQGTASTLGRLQASDSGAAERTSLLVAGAELVAACSDRWRRLGRLAMDVDLSWSVGGVLTANVALTGRGRAALSAAVGPMLVDPERWASLPMGLFARWRRDAFLAGAPEAADLPTTPRALWEEALACPAGHPVAAAAALSIGLPATELGAWMPLWLPEGSRLLGDRPSSLAVGWLIDGPGPRGPRMALASVAAPTGFLSTTEPLGPDAVMEVTPTGPRFVLERDATELAYQRRALDPDREAAFLGFGPKALADLLAAAERVPASGPLAQASLSAAALAQTDALEDDPAGRAALLLWAARRVAIVAAATYDGERLQYRLEFQAPLAPPATPK